LMCISEKSDKNLEWIVSQQLKELVTNLNSAIRIAGVKELRSNFYVLSSGYV